MKTVNFRLWYLERIWFSTLTRSMKCWYNFIFGSRSKLSQWQSFGFLNGCSIQQPRKWYEYKWDLDDEITLRAAAEIFNIEFVIISILGRAAKANTTQQNFASQGGIYLGHFAENLGEYYIVVNAVEDSNISNESFDTEVKKKLLKILNLVGNFDKPNESVHFQVEKISVDCLN